MNILRLVAQISTGLEPRIFFSDYLFKDITFILNHCVCDGPPDCPVFSPFDDVTLTQDSCVLTISLSDLYDFVSFWNLCLCDNDEIQCWLTRPGSPSLHWQIWMCRCLLYSQGHPTSCSLKYLFWRKMQNLKKEKHQFFAKIMLW